MYSEAVGWTGEKARIGVKRMDILNLQRQIRRLMAELGGRVYDLSRRGNSVDEDAAVQRLIEDIRRLERELGSREEEIEALKGHRGSIGDAGDASGKVPDEER
jgi:hypothetical protein